MDQGRGEKGREVISPVFDTLPVAKMERRWKVG